MAEAQGDSDVAFNLQLEEALTASLLEDTALSTTYDAVFGATLSSLIQSDNLYKYEHELLSHYNAEAEMKRAQLDLSRQIHDRAFALEIAKVPEPEWRETGDYINRPYGEGSSTNNGEVWGFRVYVKGLVGVNNVGGAIGVAICDGNDGLVFELSKCLGGNGNDVEMVEVKALIEGLEVAVMLDLKRITIVMDSPLLHQIITGKTPQKKPNVASLSDQINLLLRKFTHTRASLVALKDIKFAFELARNAMAFQVNHAAGSSKGKNLTEYCAICLDDIYVDQMFQITGCQHSYCFSCMSKHVQFKLLQGIIPECPHENCHSQLKLESCKSFLTPELFDIMNERVKETSIPAIEKIYCPYPKCSTLLSKTELQNQCSEGSSNTAPKFRRCPQCSGYFCIKCKVPWHYDMDCSAFERLNTYPSNEEKKLKSLATKNLWRQCPKCNHMVSLAEGCYHIYCRCGHEFCYTCGAEWKNKKATCKCPIWDEQNILYDEQNRRRGI